MKNEEGLQEKKKELGSREKEISGIEEREMSERNLEIVFCILGDGWGRIGS